MEEFPRLTRLPAYVFNITSELKATARRRGEDIIDFGMGNPDGATPKHIVDKMVEAAQKPVTHRYSVSKGLPRLRKAIANWYRPPLWGRTRSRDRGHCHYRLQRRDCAPLSSHAWTAAMWSWCRTRATRSTFMGRSLPGANVRSVAVHNTDEFLAELEHSIPLMYPRPKMLILNFPANPTTQCVDLPFFERVVALCREHEIYLVHDLAYADLTFDGYRAPSVLEVPGAKEIAVEFFTLSKSYNMPGWRVGFMVGNRKLVAALARLKSYFDYGTFTPIQVASILALEGPQDCVTEIVDNYRRRRDVLVQGFDKAGWKVQLPKATMFVWAEIPEPYRHLGSLEFSRKLLLDAKVAVSPGIGFGEFGDGHVRFSLIENEERTRQALRGIRQMFAHDGVLTTTV